ncbi:hypothetical protein ACTI_43820 [Actinoplanes sp. OR16]|uniref:hypothetical protein n=1 Tax=Actinoplanes sp. OR16 TaxID=946334 RepID=UPI000F6E5DB9|nr:hypothetical protein [Actinoplanes sp. OR16]BBH67697.1 hypothetical protein ACTI_43820 [Actinoplanes sp. OR16]
MDYLVTLLPRPLRPVIRPLLLAQVDPRVLRACGLRSPSAARRRASGALMRAAGRAQSGDTATTIGRLTASVYPNGWSPGDLGTHPPHRSES